MCVCAYVYLDLNLFFKHLEDGQGSTQIAIRLTPNVKEKYMVILKRRNNEKMRNEDLVISAIKVSAKKIRQRKKMIPNEILDMMKKQKYMSMLSQNIRLCTKDLGPNAGEIKWNSSAKYVPKNKE